MWHHRSLAPMAPSWGERQGAPTMQRMFIAKWVTKEAERPRIQELLPELAEKSRAEKGNVFYTIYQSEADPNVFILHECYADAAAAEGHGQSEHYQRIVVSQITPHLVVREVMVVKHLL